MWHMVGAQSAVGIVVIFIPGEVGIPDRRKPHGKARRLLRQGYSSDSWKKVVRV